MAQVAQRQCPRRFLCHQFRRTPPHQRATTNLLGKPRCVQGENVEFTQQKVILGSWIWLNSKKQWCLEGWTKHFGEFSWGFPFWCPAGPCTSIKACQSIPLVSNELSNEIWKQPPLLGHLSVGPYHRSLDVPWFCLDRNSPIYPPTWHISPWGGSAIIPITGNMAGFFFNHPAVLPQAGVDKPVSCDMFLSCEPRTNIHWTAKCPQADPPDHPLEAPEALKGGLKPSKLPKAVPGTCNVATSKNSQLAMDQNSSAHNSLCIYIYYIYTYNIKPSILRGDNFEPYPHGFLVDNMGLGGCVLIQELCVRGISWLNLSHLSSKFFKLVRTRDKKILVISDLGLDNQGPDLVDISQKIGHKRHRIGSPCEVPSAFNVFNHSPIQDQPRRARSLHYLINCHPLFLASEKDNICLQQKGVSENRLYFAK